MDAFEASAGSGIEWRPQEFQERGQEREANCHAASEVGIMGIAREREEECNAGG